MSLLTKYLEQFDVIDNKTRYSYSCNGCKLFCILKTKSLTIGVAHRKEFADYAKKCNAYHIGQSNGIFDGWIRFDNTEDALKFIKYVVDVKLTEYKK